MASYNNLDLKNSSAIYKPTYIDLTDEAFWISALETAKSRIEQFIELSK